MIFAADATFRCEHWRCVLAMRHCLRRQKEMKRVPNKKTPNPVHPYCAGGTCDQGNEIARRLADVKVKTRKLDNRVAPRLDIVRAVEERMDKGAEMKTRACCGSKGKHLASCTVAAETPMQAAGLSDSTVAELLELREMVQAELERREKELQEQLHNIRKMKAKPGQEAA